MIPNHTTLDLETSIKNRGDDSIGDFKAAPYHPDNKIVSAGFLVGDKYTDWYYTEESRDKFHNKEATLLVGQNIKFDLLYLLKTFKWYREELVKHHTVWDTQLAEYLLTGQESQYASLNEMSRKYGGTQKKDIIKEYWDKDVDTEDIPKDELMEYMEYDVRNTELIFQAQYVEAEERGILPLIESQMDAILATTEMEYNGMCFDKPLAKEYIAPLLAEMEPIEAAILDTLEAGLPHFGTKLSPYSAGSGDQISLYLFGGEYKGREWLPVGANSDHEVVLIKSGKNKGQVRHKYVYDTYEAPQRCVPKEAWKLKKAHLYQVDEKVLKTVKSSCKDEETRTFITNVLKYRELNKELSTYLVGYSNLAWPEDGMWYMHGRFNHTATDTGRLSSSKPNLQNVSGKGE